MTTLPLTRAAQPRGHRGAPRPVLPVQRDLLYLDPHRIEVMRHGAGDPLIFLHGFGACPTIYRDGLRAVAARGREVIAPALPSFGLSTPLPVRQQGVSGVAVHMGRVLDALGFAGEPVDMVGHSFGGGVALRIAADRPEVVRSLTLICPVGGAGRGAATVPGMLTGILFGDAGKRWLHNGVRYFLPALTRHAVGVLATGLAAWFSDQIADVDAVAAAGIPVRFVFADRDRLVRPGAIPTRARGALSVEVIPGRHSWLIGEPDRFATVVLGEPVPTGRDGSGPRAA